MQNPSTSNFIESIAHIPMNVRGNNRYDGENDFYNFHMEFIRLTNLGYYVRDWGKRFKDNPDMLYNESNI